MKVAVFGLRYAGAVTVAGLLSQGHTVVGVDVAAAKVELINSGRGPVFEPGLDRLIDALPSAGPRHVKDVDGRLRADVEALPGYKGVVW